MKENSGEFHVFTKPNLMIRIISLLAIFVVFSCTYTPSGNNFNNIEKPSLPTTELNLTNVPSDSTIYLIRPTVLSFEVSSNMTQSFEGAVYLNESVIKRFSTNNTQFQISPAGLANGSHNLQVVIQISTESGSLADQFDSEYFQIEKNWDIEVDKSGGKQLPILSSTATDSGLVITWTKYDKRNFSSYSLVRRNVNSSFTYHYQTLATIYDIDQNYFSVNDITGNDYEYRTVLNCYCEEQTSFISDWHLGALESSKILSYTINSDKVTVTWNKPPIKSNFSKYTLTVDSRPPSTLEYTVFESTDINDTTVTVNVPFGSTFDFVIAAHNNSRIATREKKEFAIGESFAPFDENALPYYSETNNQFYFIDPEKIVIADSTSGEEQSRFAIKKSRVSSNYFVGIKTSSPYDNIIQLINQVDLSVQKEIKIDTLLGARYKINHLATAYNSSFILIDATNTYTNETKAYLINYETNKIVFEFTVEPSPKSRVALSRNAKYVVVGKAVFDVTYNSPQRLGTLPYLTPVEFDNISDENLYFIDGSAYTLQLLFYKASTVDRLWKVIQSNISNNTNRRFYWESGLYTGLGASIEGLYVFDPRNNKTKIVSLNEFGNSYLIYRNRFLSSNGFQANYEF